MTSKEANEQRIAEMTNDEVLALIEQLTANTVNLIKARSWRNSGSELLPSGEDAQTLVQFALGKVLAGAKWDQDKPIWLILQGIIRGRIQSLVNSPENKRLIDCDEDSFDKASDEIEKYEEPTPRPPDPSGALEEKEAEELLFGIIEELEQSGRNEEKEIVEAIFAGCLKRTEILEETGLGEAEYEAAKKRLRRYLKEYRQESSVGHH